MKWIAPFGATNPNEQYVNAAPTVAGSNPDAKFFNTVLNELLAVITTANMTPSDTNLHQVSDAIVYLAERAATSGVIKGSYWFGKTTANFTVPNPTAVGQTYIDFTTLNTYISNDGETWVQNGTFTPPVGIDYTILITSKFWDISEQTNQQGGDAIYSHTTETWTYWPKIIDLGNVANTDLNNLTSAGANILNWSKNATNCFIKVPQDIKVEIVNNQIVLKAGSKVYIPNGFESDYITPKYDVRIIENDITTTGSWGNSGSKLTSICCVHFSSDQILIRANHLSTDDTQEHGGIVYNNGYNRVLSDNDLNYNGGPQYFSLPFCKVYAENGVPKILTVFNGFSNIGARIWVYPGVTGLIPNGRTADGTMQSTKFTVSNILQGYIPYTVTGTHINLSVNATSIGYGCEYDAYNNYVVKDGANQQSVIFGTAGFVQSGQVLNDNYGMPSTFKTVFNPLDYTDAGKPERKITKEWYGTDSWYRLYSDGWVEQGGFGTGYTNISGNTMSKTLAIGMKDANYTALITVSHPESDQGAYYARVLEERTSTALKYFMYYNGAITTNNPKICWYVCGWRI